MQSGLQDDAERRANDLIAQRNAEKAARATQEAENRARREQRNQMADALGAATSTNNTPNVATIAANDWANNSQRSLNMQNIDGQGFVEPRWQPDEEVVQCNRCRRQ